MTDRATTFTTFTIERSYPADPSRVFAAFASAEAKARWMGSQDVQPAGRAAEFDFRVGGRESFSFTEPDGPMCIYDARYYDIVPDQRIVYCYEMYADNARISVSVATVELAKDAAGTRMTYTEQGAYLDGLDDPADRKEGTEEQFDALGQELQSPDGRR